MLPREFSSLEQKVAFIDNKQVENGVPFSAITNRILVGNGQVLMAGIGRFLPYFTVLGTVKAADSR